MNMTTQLSFPFEELLNVDETAAENEFFDLWDRIRWRPGELPLDAALRQSQEKPLRLDARIAKKRPSGYPAFVSLAGWLQIVIGTTKPILLPVTGVADALGVTTACVSRYRRWAREDGYLLELRPSVKPKNGRPGYATEFRFDVNRFPVLLKQTGQGDIED